jgi:uncharacterized protein (DUF1778 family)
MSNQTSQIHIRLAKHEKDAIKAKAQAAGVSVSTLVLRTMLGEDAEESTVERLEAVERRVSRLEGVAGLD